jgi:hypothetical protein
MKDSPEQLRAAADYLEKNTKRPKIVSRASLIK